MTVIVVGNASTSREGTAFVACVGQKIIGRRKAQNSEYGIQQLLHHAVLFAPEALQQAFLTAAGHVNGLVGNNMVQFVKADTVLF